MSTIWLAISLSSTASKWFFEQISFNVLVFENKAYILYRRSNVQMGQVIQELTK